MASEFLASGRNERRLTHRRADGERDPTATRLAYSADPWWSRLHWVVPRRPLACLLAYLHTSYSWYAIQGVSPTDVIPLLVALLCDICPICDVSQ